MSNTTKTKTVKKQKISFPTRIMLIFNLIFIGLLLFSYLALYISPVAFWPPAFAGILYPLFLMINLFFILFWLVFLKRHFILSLLAILLGFNQLKTYIGFNNSHQLTQPSSSFKVMSYNVRLFDLYNWVNVSSKSTRKAIFDLIEAESPDILCLQEYYSGAGKKADFADTICSKAGFKFRYIELLNNENSGLPYGLAIFSKYPIISTYKLEFSNSKVNFCQVCDIRIGKDTIRVMNMHLESIKFGKEDYNFVDEITNKPKNEKLRQGSLAIVGKMKKAYISRAKQIEHVAEYLKSSRYPVILTGDFNDTPVSYAYRQINNILIDAFAESGNGLGQTYAEKIPLLRIDYIFHSKQLKSNTFQTLKVRYSDHYPLIGYFNLADSSLITR